MWAVFNPCLLVQSDFSSRFSGLVWYGSLQWPIHLKTRSTSFDSIEIAAQNLMVRKSLITKVSRRRLKLLKCQR